MYCNKCGAQLIDGARFCSGCGAPTVAYVGAVGVGTAPSAEQEKYKVMDDVTSRLNSLAGGTGSVKLRFGDFFDSILKKHTREEAEELFVCGTNATTPPVNEVSADWPHPWLYSRVFLVLLATFIGCVVLGFELENLNAFPGIMFVGAMVVPFSLLIFFFETNAPRNINMVDIVKIFFIGGIFSILLIYPLSSVLPGGGVGLIVPSMITGIVEELAKIVLTAFFLSRVRGRGYILNGLLIGSAVGAGFAVFESAGYAFNALLSGDSASMLENIVLRAFLSIGGHTAWAAVEGAAMGLCEKDGVFDWRILVDKRFLIFAASMILLHGIWDMYVLFLDNFGIIKYLILIAAVWVFVIVLLNRGLEQVNELADRPKGVDAEASSNVAQGGISPTAVESVVAVAGSSDAQVLTGIYCPKCGTKHAEGERLCRECGMVLS